MKKLLFIAALFIAVVSYSQTSITCGNNTVIVTGEKLSSVKYIGRDKKTNAVTNYYYRIDSDSLKVWEEYINEGERESIITYTIHKKDINRKSMPYLDELPGSEYEKPLKRIYISCNNGECVQSASYFSWKQAGDVTLSTNIFCQIDGTDLKIHQAFLDKILAWLK